MTQILFTSVLGPYGVDSGRSRFKNPMGLLANQVTRGQSYYTVQMCSRTFAFDLFGANLNAEVATLDFPLPRQLEGVLRAGRWDRVGVSSIAANFESLLATYQLIRDVLPDVPIDVGGHIATDEGVVKELVGRMLELHPADTFRVWEPAWEGKRLGRDRLPINSWLEGEGRLGPGVTFVKRDGLDYYAQLGGVGLRDSGFVHAPLVDASFGKRVFGIPVPSTSAGLMVPDVGCPMKCSFCATSYKFDGRFVQYLRTAEDIMAVANAQADRGRTEMFVMSENFSLDTKRALRLLRLMEEQKRPHRYTVFSSANGLAKLGIENIVKLGYCFVWIGLEESTGRTYDKLHGIDTRELIRSLQAHGVEVLGSTILGLEHHRKADLDREVDHALSHDCVYNQFMLYMPIPGTGLWEEMKAAGKLKQGFPWMEIHGQARQNWHHPHLAEAELEERLDRAFVEDFEVLGPSLYRMMKVHYDGYVKTRDWDHELVQLRRAATKKMFVIYLPLLGAMSKDLGRMNHRVCGRLDELREALLAETGLSGRAASALATPLVRASMALEARRHRRAQVTRVAENPRCHLTHYGTFDHRYPRGVPRPEPRPQSVAIPRRRVPVEPELVTPAGVPALPVVADGAAAAVG